MTAATQLESAVADLSTARKCLQERSDTQIVDALARVLERWRDPASACRRELQAELPAAVGFTPQTVHEGLELGFEHWTGEALERLVADEFAAGSRSKSLSVRGYPLTSVLLAGSIPMPSVLSILLPLVLRCAVVCKPASRDPITPALVVDSLREVDPLLADCVTVVPFERDDAAANEVFYSSPCVVATGSNATLEEVERYLAPHQRRVLYGHRVSIAVVELERATAEVISSLAVDVALWDQLGCLSPIAFYLVGGREGAVEAFAETLAAALASAQQRWPRGTISAESASTIVRQRSEAEMRSALGRSTRVIASSGTDWTVVLEDDTELRPAPLNRFIRLIPVAERNLLPAALQPLGPHLAGVALAGFERDHANVSRQLFELGASRVCPPGRLQAPPIDWCRDNQPLLLGMALLGKSELD